MTISRMQCSGILWHPGDEWRSRAWSCIILVGLMILDGMGAVSSQRTYAVFPAVPQQSTGLASQPTERGATHVTLVVHDSTIEYAVSALARQAKLQPIFTNSPVLARRISVHVVDMNLMDAFATVLKGTGLMAKLASDGEMVMVRATRNTEASTERTQTDSSGVVIGRVTDSASGQGLVGATVKVQGVSLSAITSDSGRFTLKSVPLGKQVLTVRLFGFKPATHGVTVADSGRTTVHITMIPVATVLSGVVTTASGLQRKIEVGNDITTINVDSVMRVAPITSVTDLLETRVPGLTVMHTSGVPGDPSRLRLRGAGSASLNNDPILIVDGVRAYAAQSDSRNNNLANSNFAAPSPLDQIDPSSIETIEVFKGPSASALYGSDAAAGVIVITTKHGRAGPTHWDMTLGQGLNYVPGTYPLNYYRFGSDQFGALDNGSVCPWDDNSCHTDSLVAFQALTNPQYTLFSQGHDQTENLTISGGVPTLTYSLTGSLAGNLGYLKLPGIEQARYNKFYGPIPGYLLRPDNYTTWGVNSTLAAQPSPAARVTLTSSLFNSDQQRSDLEQAIPQLEAQFIDASQLDNHPLITNDVDHVTASNLTSTNAVTLNWQLTPRAPLTATVGVNSMQRTDLGYVPFGVNLAGPGQATDTNGYYATGRGSSHDATLSLGTALPYFGQLLTVAVGGNANEVQTSDVVASTQQLAPGVSTPVLFQSTFCGEGCASFSQGTSAASTYGWYLEPRLNFNSRFFIAPGFRLDGGSGGSHAAYNAGGVNTGSGLSKGQYGGIGDLSLFPKIDFSWVAVDRQSGAPLFGVLTLLRPRVAYGLAGTQPGAADKLRLFNVNSGQAGFNYALVPPGQDALTQNASGCTSFITVDGETLVPAVCLNALGNTQLRPERSRELEGGLDATLWNGRLSLSWTQYNKTRFDAILTIPVAPSVSGPGWGGSAIEENIGVIQNTGTELTVDGNVVQRRSVSWHIGGNLTKNNSLVERLNTGQVPNKSLGVVPGYPLFGQWTKSIVGFADANHDGIIEPGEIRYGDTLMYIGEPVANFESNLYTDVALFGGRVSAHATVAYTNGLTQFNYGALTSGSFALLPNSPSSTLATQAAVCAAVNDGVALNVSSANCTRQSIVGITQVVNTLRFNDLSVNVVVPTAVSTHLHVPRMTMALQGSNLGLHSNYRGIDPSVNAFSTVSVGDQTADKGEIPLPRTWWLKLSMGN